MKKPTFALVLGFVIWFSATDPASTLQSGAWKEETVENALERIPGNAAWILLGFVDSHQKWVMDPPFKVKHRDPGVAGSWKFPQVDDRIIMDSPTRLVIVDYATGKEGNASKSPAALTKLTANDTTGFLLKEGSVVRVLSVEIGVTVETLRPVWAKVAPAPVTR